MTKPLTIRDTSRNGLYQIADTRWDSNGTMFVTVRELYGVSMFGPQMLLDARRLARRAIDRPELTRSSRVVTEFASGGCAYVTFAVSRLP